MPRKRLILTHLLATLLLGAGSHAARAQNPSPAAPAQTPAPMRVRLVVSDKRHQTAGNLTREELRVTLSGVEQTLSALVKDESPLSYGLVVDNSGSLRSQITAVVAAAKHIVSNARPEDAGFVVRFVSSDNMSGR